MKRTSKLDLAKQATKLVVGYGTGLIVTGIAVNNAIPKNTPQKIAVVIAGTVLAMAAREKVGEYTDAKIDEAVAWWNDTIKKTEETEPEAVEA